MGERVAGAAALIVFCLFSLFSFSHADSPNPQWGIDVTLYAFLVMAVVLSAAFIGMAYMVSQLFNAPALGAWVKIEVQELAMSAMIVVFLVAMVATVNSAVRFATGSNDAYSAAIGYLDEVRDLGLVLHQKLVEVGFWVNMAVGFSYSTAVSVTPIKVGGNWSSAPASGMGGLAGAVGNAVDSVALMALLVGAQKVFLVFFMSIVAIVMPLGVVLRTFPLTRRIGALLLGAGVGIAVVYPTALVLSKEIYENYAAQIEGRIDNAAKGVPHLGAPPASDVMCNPKVQFVASGFGLGEIGWWLAICSVSCPISAAIQCAGTGPGYGACFAAKFAYCFNYSCREATDKWYSIGTSAFAVGMGEISREYISDADAAEYFNAINEHALPAATEYIVLMLVLFLLPLIFTIVLVRNFISLFGGESQLYGLFKLVG